MKRFEHCIRQVEPYVPGEQPQKKVIKLNTNENPYPPAPEVQQTLRRYQAERLRLYPDPTAKELSSALAERYGVKQEQVFVGVGSDDVLAMCFLTFFNSGSPILFPDMTYSFYPVWAGLYGIPYECPHLDDSLHMKGEDYYKENGGIIFPNPNAPTGVFESLDVIEDILQHNQDVIVIVDEAYVDFGPESAVKLLKEYDNLLVVQTFSKSRSMAGMRIGFAMGSPFLIRCLNDVKYSFNSYTLSGPAIACGTAAVKADEYFKERIEELTQTREWAKEEFRKLGFQFPDSQANFLFVTHPQISAEKLFRYLKEKDIFVRYFGEGRTENYLRVTIGRREEMKVLFEMIQSYIENTKR